jgi:organic radical activating enzyme
MKVCEIFESIQGEGRYAGVPALFIRLSGCNRKPACDFCDSKYHEEGKEMSVQEVVDVIDKSNKGVVIWSGGEPLSQIMDVITIIVSSKGIYHYLETNGDLLEEDDIQYFDYVCVSPKDKKIFSRIPGIGSKYDIDIKVVTDLELNRELIPYATMLMPLTTFDDKKDKIIRQNVWDYCVKHNIKYSPRLHIEVWGLKRRV